MANSNIFGFSHLNAIKSFDNISDLSNVQHDISIIHFNMLADSLCFDNGKPTFPHLKNPEEILSWERRCKLILKCLEQVNADFICMVEVDKFEDLLASLMECGYDGIFAKKNSEDHQDGCAIFYKRNKWNLEGREWKSLAEGHSQIGLYGYFASIKPMQQSLDDSKQCFLTVVSTHLKAKEGATNENVRMKEIVSLVDGVRELEPRITTLTPSGKITLKNYSKRVIIAGDFNDVPQSPPMQLFEKQLSGFFWGDAHKAEIAKGDHYTTYKRRKKTIIRCIDYIKYTKNTLCLMDNLPLPKAICFPQGLPTYDHPSDHLLLLSFFSLF